MIRVVLCTAPAAEAEELAKKLLSERLIACANLVRGVRSLYWWQGKVEEGEETMMVMKTDARSVRPLIRRLRALHSYQTAEILVLPVKDGNPRYLRWVLAETTRSRACPQRRKRGT
jgi:periplasmic divalent cation tolerance protein